jgi:hypothetical protein
MGAKQTVKFSCLKGLKQVSQIGTDFEYSLLKLDESKEV